MNSSDQPTTIFDELYRLSNENFKRKSSRQSVSKSSTIFTNSSKSNSDESIRKIEIAPKRIDTSYKRINIKYLKPLNQNSSVSNVTLNELSVEKILLKPRKIIYKDKTEQILPKTSQEDTKKIKSIKRKKDPNVLLKSNPIAPAIKLDKNSNKENKIKRVTRFKDELVDPPRDRCFKKVIPELETGFDSKRINLDNLEKDDSNCKCNDKYSTITVDSIFESNKMILENLYESINIHDNNQVNVKDVIRVLNQWNKINRDCFSKNNLKVFLNSIATNDGFINFEQFKSAFLFNLLN